MRDGDRNGVRAVTSASPFVVEALVEGPWEAAGVTWLASVRRSLIEETSGILLGNTQPLTFESQLIKVTPTSQEDDRCSVLALRTSDRSRIDPDEKESHIAWKNLLGGLHCVTVRGAQLLEVNFSYSSSSSTAVSRGASKLEASVWRAQHDLHATTLIGSLPFYAGYHLYLEDMDYDLSELFSDQSSDDDGVFGASAYVEASVQAGTRFEARPGVVLTASPRPALEPRVRASWKPFGRSSEMLQGAVGLYRQNAVGTSDMRDVGSVFTAWMSAPDGVALEAQQAMLGWQQSLGSGVRWSVDGYYKRLKAIPVPVWQATARFNTELGRADGQVYGIDTRIEHSGAALLWLCRLRLRLDAVRVSAGRIHHLVRREPVQHYHPPHDRRHQLNALASLDVAGLEAGRRHQRVRSSQHVLLRSLHRAQSRSVAARAVRVRDAARPIPASHVMHQRSDLSSPTIML
jgi:hypothetical protein